MLILLDESLSRKLALELPGHHAQTVQKRGWSGLKNRALLREASQEFQVLLTGDRKLGVSAELGNIVHRSHRDGCGK